MPFCFFESTVSMWPIVMPSLRGGSHSLMMVLSEHLDLFTPLAGSRLIGRVGLGVNRLLRLQLYR